MNSCNNITIEECELWLNNKNINPKTKNILYKKAIIINS